MRVHEAAEQFLTDLEADGRSPHTVAAYRRDLSAFTEFAGDTVIDAVTPAMLTTFMASTRVQVRPCGTQRAKATVNRYRVSLKALFAWAAARWLVDRNPTDILRCRRQRALAPAVLTEAEVDQLLSISFAGRTAERDSALLAFLLGTGCRLGETVQLDVRDIDLAAGTVTLRRPKGGEPERITLARSIIARSWFQDRRSEPDRPLWSVGCRRLSARQIQRIIGRRAAEAGITKHVTPHTLRHTFATRLYNATGDLRLVQVALRHGHVTTTEQYAQVNPERLEAALGAV